MKKGFLKLNDQKRPASPRKSALKRFLNEIRYEAAHRPQD